MANSRTVNSLGVLAVIAILGAAYFGVAAPVLAEKSALQLELQHADQLNQNFTSKLQSFQKGESDEAKEATNMMDLFTGLVPESIDIESASRAIAASLPPGVKLDSFDFGQPQQVSTIKTNPLSISGFTVPPEFNATDSAAAPPAQNQEDAVKNADKGSAPAASGDQAVNPSAATSGFNRIPFTIEVSAGSYNELASYLNSLSQQPRLMSVVSIDSSRADSVSAKIYAFAFSGR